MSYNLNYDYFSCYAFDKLSHDSIDFYTITPICYLALKILCMDSSTMIIIDSSMHDSSWNLHIFDEVLPRLIYYVNFKYEFIDVFVGIFNYD